MLAFAQLHTRFICAKSSLCLEMKILFVYVRICITKEILCIAGDTSKVYVGLFIVFVIAYRLNCYIG